MKKNNIIFWTSTGIIALMMGFSGFSYFTNPEVVDGFKQMGFPDYFRVELGIAKIAAVIALVIPQIPKRIKEWAYVGLGIVFISASVAHFGHGDTIDKIITPMVIMAILAVSYIYKEKRAAMTN